MMKKYLLLLGTLIFLFALPACGGQSAGTGADASGGRPLVPADASVSAPEVTKPNVSPTTGVSQMSDSSQPADNSGEAAQLEDAAVPSPPEPTEKPGQPASGSVSKPKGKTEPAEDKPTLPAQSSQIEETPDGGAEPDTQPEPPKASKEAASAYIGRSVSSLIAAIGQPKGRDYAPSCLGDGEDGELFYDGFTVYTYRANGKEIVQDII